MPTLTQNQKYLGIAAILLVGLILTGTFTIWNGLALAGGFALGRSNLI